MKHNDSPFQYEEVFSLILSMYHQFVSDKSNMSDETETIQNYFHRLTRSALGEFEFARRAAYEGLKVNRLTHYDVLSSIYKQKASADFIIAKDNISALVDVKNYSPSSVIINVLIDKSSIDRAIENKESFNVDYSLIGIKRFHRWYLIDVKDIAKWNRYKKINDSNTYVLSIEFLAKYHKSEFLNEVPLAINMGDGKELNLGNGKSFYPDGLEKGIDIFSIKEKKGGTNFVIEFSQWTEKKEKKKMVLDSNQAQIVFNVKNQQLSMLNNICFSNNIVKIREIPEYSDLAPTVFSVSDPIINNHNGEYQNPHEHLTYALDYLINSKSIVRNNIEYHIGKSWVYSKSLYANNK